MHRLEISFFVHFSDAGTPFVLSRLHLSDCSASSGNVNTLRDKLLRVQTDGARPCNIMCMYIYKYMYIY